MEEGSSAVFVSTLFDASQLLLDTLKLFRESAALRGIQIRTDVTPRIEIYASEEQYRQMLELLFDNAVKYARENGFISVVLKQERRDLILRVRNNCDSLPAADPDQLFERFFRADQSRSRQTGGSGIGLAVVRAIAQKNGGKATAGYPEDDVIEFEIILPLVYNIGRKTKG
jgi:signal transduction histidine kinase